jgi:hypothetical protein
MLDVAVAYNRYRFLGFEFLTWLWFTIETDQPRISVLQPDGVSLEIGNRLVLENRQGETMEIITIRGDDAGLEEGRLALQKGAVVTEINLSLRISDQRWQFTLKGESLSLSNLKIPETGPVETREDVEGALLEKFYLYEKVVGLVDAAFKAFIGHRVSNEWKATVVPGIRQWIFQAQKRVEDEDLI